MILAFLDLEFIPILSILRLSLFSDLAHIPLEIIFSKIVLWTNWNLHLRRTCKLSQMMRCIKMKLDMKRERLKTLNMEKRG